MQNDTFKKQIGMVDSFLDKALYLKRNVKALVL